MRETQVKKLEAEINAMNRLHRFINDHREALLGWVTSFVGSKITKKNDSITFVEPTKAFGEAINAILDKLENEANKHCSSGERMTIRRSISSYSISVEFKVAYEVQNEYGDYRHTEYCSQSVYLGVIKNQVLVSVNAMEEKPLPEYSLNQLLLNLERARKAREEYEKAKSACCPFTDYL